MSYFGTCLDELLTRKNIKAVELARASDLQESMISRYRNGETIGIEPENLLRMTSAVADNDFERGELVRAHLLDECPRELRHTVTIAIKGEEEFRERLGNYASEAERIFAVLQDNWDDPDVQDLLKGLASILERPINSPSGALEEAKGLVLKEAAGDAPGGSGKKTPTKYSGKPRGRRRSSS